MGAGEIYLIADYAAAEPSEASTQETADPFEAWHSGAPGRCKSPIRAGAMTMNACSPSQMLAQGRSKPATRARR
jgi:hypothetical protein